MLETIHSPADVRSLSIRETEMLATEIRQVLIDAVSHTGGHLASNLGAVELTLAMHRAFCTPEDKIFFDVGHQSYTHKLITGRRDLIGTLRQEGGLSGFPKRAESEYDVFETGHSSTALSAAVGMARARDALGESYDIVALVGDGALTGGMCYEALNDAGSVPTQLIMLLNDNEMSIAQNVGALSTYLTRLRGSEGWIDTKHAVKRGLHRIPLVGEPVARALERVKRSLKLMLVPGEFFEALGFGYLGPIDGHDILSVERALRDARAMQRPVVVHAVTQKGRGYSRAEHKPEMYHGIAPFFAENGKKRDDGDNGSDVAVGPVVGEAMLALAGQDSRVIAVTAAMMHGTGLEPFAKAHPDRFFDVGIAEEHAMTMAAGMAAGGMRPYFAVYASFLQRACDQLLHDICLQNLPVTVLVDHAGFVPGDGQTHQGVYDLAMLRAMPNLTVWTPCDAKELRQMILASADVNGPCVIRYPKSLPKDLGDEAPPGTWHRYAGQGEVHLLAYGHALQQAQAAQALLEVDGIPCTLWGANAIMPLDAQALEAVADADLLAIVEEEQVSGGLGEAVAGHFAAAGHGPRLLLLGIDGHIPCAHSMDGLAAECGLGPEQIAGRIKEALHGR